MRRIRSIVPALCALAIAACGGSSGGGYSTGPTGGNNNPPNNPGTSNPVSTSSVTLTTASFTPATIAIAKGTTVTWTWDTCGAPDPYGYGGATCVSHNIVFDDGTTSSAQSTGTFTRRFDGAGTFKYHCAIHGAAMSGEVDVQ
jgi:plastocyanin